LPAVLNADWYEAVQQMDFDLFVKYLKQQGIRCQRAVDKFFEPDVLILLWPNQGVIEVGFSSQAEYTIHKMLYSTLDPRNYQLEDCW
jgi:hypothetical protein